MPAILMWTTGVQGFDTLPHELDPGTKSFRENRKIRGETHPIFCILQVQ